MSVDRKKLNALLKWYRQEIGKDLIGALIVDREGLIMDSIAGSSEDKSIDEENILIGI